MITEGDSKSDEDWIIGSVCTFHRCSNRDLFSSYEIVTKGSVMT